MTVEDDTNKAIDNTPFREKNERVKTNSEVDGYIWARLFRVNDTVTGWNNRVSTSINTDRFRRTRTVGYVNISNRNADRAKAV